MNKLSSLAAVVALAAGAAALALPASAASVASCQRQTVLGPNGVYIDAIEASADTIAIELRQRGYNVDTVGPWGGCVKAFINDGGGRQHMEFIEPDTLEPLTTN